jgi:hypothetical protein
MSKSSKSGILPILHEDDVLVDDTAPKPELRDATHADIQLIHKIAKDVSSAKQLSEFEEMIAQFKPTLLDIWKIRILATFNAFKDTNRQFQQCLQVATDMQKYGFKPTDSNSMIKILEASARSFQEKEILKSTIESLSTPVESLSTPPAPSTASDGGRPKMRRQIRSRSRHRLNKSKKIRRRKERRTRHRNRSYS